MASTNSEIASWLKKASTTWDEKKTEAKAEGLGSQFDDGKYVAQLVGAKLEMSKSGNPQIRWIWRFLDSDYKGEKKFDFDGLANSEESLKYVAKKFLAMGIDPDSIDFANLETVLAEVVGMNIVAQIQLKTKGEYQNLLNIRPVDDWGGDTFEPESEDDGGKKPVKPNAAPLAGGKKPVKPNAAPLAGGKKAATPEPEAEEEVPEEEVEDEVPEEEEGPLHVGQPVSFTWKGDTLTGTVKEILEEKAKIKSGSMVYPVAFDKITADNSKD